MSSSLTYRDLAGSFSGWHHQADLFGHRPDPAVEAARQRFHRRMARQRRRDSVAPFLAEPWRAWSADGPAAALARRFLARYPDRDLPPPECDLLTDRQSAAEYHRDEESNEMLYERRGR